MEAQRTFLAIALCVLVIIGWNFLTPLLHPETPIQTNATEQADSADPVAGGKTAARANATTVGEPSDTPDALMVDDSSAAVAGPVSPADFGRVLNVNTPLLGVSLSPQGGVIKELQLLKFNQALGSSEKVKLIDSEAGITSCLGLYINGHAAWGEPNWTSNAAETTTLTGEESATLTFSGTFQGLQITREMTFKADSYLITEKVRVQNPGAAAQSMMLPPSIAMVCPVT